MPVDADETGEFGFITDEIIALDKKLQIPELNSGFLINDKCSTARLLDPVSTDKGVKSVYQGDGEVPLLFKAKLPGEGNYTVKVRIFAEEDTEGLLFIGRRHLAMKRRFSSGESFEGTYTVNVCPIIPRTYNELMEDLTLDIALAGRGLVLADVEISGSDSPTIYIAGDSTVTDQSAAYPYDPAFSYSGWGQMLSYFIANDVIAVSNHAHSGLTTESMRSEGHYAILYDRIKTGDICLFQFGHNDQKLESLKAFEGYTANLVRYIDEIKSKGATPVIVSPLARNTWKSDGSYNDLLEEYARACEAAAIDKEVPYIDLHAFSMGFVKDNGRETARRWYYPSDYTHTNDYGAYLFAGYVYSELVRQGLLENISNTVIDNTNRDSVFSWKNENISKENISKKNTSKKNTSKESDISYKSASDWLPPEEPPQINLPEISANELKVNNVSGERSLIGQSSGIQSRNCSDTVQSGPECRRDTGNGNDVSSTDVERELLAGIAEPDEIITRAKAFEMVIRTVKFFPTNVYNDLFSDVIGHETYAGIIECALQNGIIPESMIEESAETGEKHILPEKPILLPEFIAILRLGYLSRRPECGLFEKLDVCGLKGEDTLTGAQAAHICAQVKV
ncbi:MAG: rhamnogalacturonan acetylesterase [Lachnospiraceae bacterium]|nr:rhamnogalacturonan acetylesterase [Lachnospiraceae bacterium]